MQNSGEDNQDQRAMEIVFSKILTETDIWSRLAIPIEALKHILPPGAKNAWDILVRDWEGNEWTYGCRTRQDGHPKPVITTGWLDFVRAKQLKSGDEVILHKHEDGAGLVHYRVEVNRKLRVFGRDIWASLGNPNPQSDVSGMEISGDDLGEVSEQQVTKRLVNADSGNMSPNNRSRSINSFSIDIREEDNEDDELGDHLVSKCQLLVDGWRSYFCTANGDIFDIIDHAIMLAALDCPNEFKLRRDRIAEKLFMSESDVSGMRINDDSNGSGGGQNNKKDDGHDGDGNWDKDKRGSDDGGWEMKGKNMDFMGESLFGYKFGYHTGNKNKYPVGQLQYAQEVQ